MAAQRVCCSKCEAVFAIDAAAAGKSVSCPKCQAVMVPAAAPAARWTVQHGGQTSGPFTPAELRHRVAVGELQPTDQVQREGEERWVAAGLLPGVFPTAKPAPAEAARADATAPPWPRRRALLIAGAGGLLVAVGATAYFSLAGGSSGPAPTRGAQVASTPPPITLATRPAPRPRKVFDPAFAAESFTGAVIIHPKRLLASPTGEALPREALFAPLHRLGLDPAKVNQVVLYFDPLPGSNLLFSPGLVVRLAEPVDVRQMLQKVAAPFKEIDLNGKPYIELDVKTPIGPVCLHSPDGKTLVVAPEPTLFRMMSGAPRGPLVERLLLADLDTDILALFAMQQVRAPAQAGLTAVSAALPPQFANLPAAADGLEALTVTLNLQGDALLALDLEAKDAAAAKALHTQLTAGQALLQQSYPGLRDQLTRAAPDAAPAIRTVGDDLLAGVTLRQEDTHVRGSMRPSKGLPELARRLGPLVKDALPTEITLPVFAGPAPATGNDMRALAVEWIKANGIPGAAAGLADQLGKQLTAQIKPGDGFRLVLSGDLVKAGKPTVLLAWGGTLFPLELTEDEGKQLGVTARMFNLLPFAADPSGPAAFALSDLKVDGAAGLDPGKKISGSVTFQRKTKDAGQFALRGMVLRGNRWTTAFIRLPDAALAQERATANFSLRSLKETGLTTDGPAMLVMEMVTLAGPDGNAKVTVVSNAQVVLIRPGKGE